MKAIAPCAVALMIASLLIACGGGSGVRFSDLFDQSASEEGTGIQFSGVVRAVVILAKHDATARQRQVAEQNGRRAVARLEARIAASERAAAPVAKQKPTHHPAVAEASAPKPKQSVATVAPSEKSGTDTAAPRPARPKPLPRIIAVATEKDEHTDKKAVRAIMLFDTHSQQIIGNKVYDIENEPKPNEDVRFETHSTSYIGASL